MSNLKLNVDRRSLNKTVSKLESAIGDSVSDSAGTILDKSIKIGKKHITDEEAIWRKEVLGQTMHADFDYTELSTSEKYVIWNSAIHAGIVDEGTQFNSLPNLTRLIPWVLDNLNDWHPFEEDDDDGGIDVSNSGGGLDAIASQVGTVTEKQDNSDEKVHGEELVREAEPYDESVFGVYSNRKQANPTPLSYELSNKLNYEDTTSITAQSSSVGFKHTTLSSDQQDIFIKSLREEYGDGPVDSILDRLYDWKKDSGTEDAQFFEKLSKANYDIDADLRFEGKFNAPEPTQDELEIYHELGVLGSEFMNRRFADQNGKVDAYRGFRGPQISALGTQIFSNPDQDRWAYQDSVIQNYTISESIADNFSEGIEASVTLDVNNHLLMAPDFTLWDSIDTTNRDAEINVIGGTRHFGKDNLSFSNVDVDTILNKDVSRFTDNEHEALYKVVNSMYKDEGLVSDPKMSDRLSDWASEYDRQIGDDSEIGSKVDAITAQPVPTSDDSDLTWANANGKEGYDLVEEGDLFETDFDINQVLIKDGAGIWLGWDDPQYFIQPEGDGWRLYSIPADKDVDTLDDLILIGETGGKYARPSNSDPVFGTWTEDKNGIESTHIYHESDAPDEIVTQYSKPDTIYDRNWMSDRVGGTFLVRLSDGSVVLATLYEDGSGWKLVTNEGNFAQKWYPPSHEKADESEVVILGLPNEVN